ncbi:hypothetical protein GBAR_LOCUS31243 [Geodia barretti]|uniref:Ribonucleases P/MRP subunit Pop8-like domain-containing protein n=1 Tax=Geodia barretti TaxID=519541 RepID=A0AA35U298_GEOBA|nr:hypothetical protein GBAR_LOCUS31243 [Geodia barretti]
MEKLQQEHCFLKISLRTENGGEIPETPTQLKALIVQALQTLHGQVGASIAVDILSYHIHDDVIGGGARWGSAIIRAPYREQAKVWSALTMCAGQDNVCTVDKVKKL